MIPLLAGKQQQRRLLCSLHDRQNKVLNGSTETLKKVSFGVLFLTKVSCILNHIVVLKNLQFHMFFPTTN